MLILLCRNLTCWPLLWDVIVSGDSVHGDVHAHVHRHGGEMVRGPEAWPGGSGRERRCCVMASVAPAEPLHGVIVWAGQPRVSLTPLLLPVTGPPGHADRLAVARLPGLTPRHPRGPGLVRGAGERLGRRVRRSGPSLARGGEAAGVHHHVLQGQQDVGCVLPVVLNLSGAGKLGIKYVGNKIEAGFLLT